MTTLSKEEIESIAKTLRAREELIERQNVMIERLLDKIEKLITEKENDL